MNLTIFNSRNTMKMTHRTLIAIIAIIIAACSTTKKSTTVVAPIVVEPVSEVPLVLVKPANGTYVPGVEELTAIQEKYKEVTMEKLKEGHLLYTASACIKCHEAVNIYRFNELQWKNIIDDMAIRAGISQEQKDAVYKYVLAIKAVQPK